MQRWEWKKRYGFERLQFNLQEFGANYENGGLILKPETEVIAVHIPRTGTRLDRESLTASYTPAILKIMQVPADTWDYAVGYTRIIFLGTLGSMGDNMNAGILRGMGDSKSSLGSIS